MRITLLTVITILFFSCTNTTKVPKDVLPKKKMERVLWDIIQAERFSYLYLQKDSTLRNVQLQKFKFYDQIFAMHKVSKDDFVSSYKYYLSRPDLAKPIFDSIAARAERQKSINYKAAAAAAK
jgi:Domain of unknown function (DUF4296)